MQVDDVRAEIAANVRAELGRAQKQQGDLAALLGVDGGSASLRLQGKRSFRAEELAKIADWLDIPVTRLMPDEVAA